MTYPKTAAACTQIVLEEIYRDCHQLTLAELRTYLNSKATKDIIDGVAAIWAKKEIDWDIEHLMLAVDHLEACNDRISCRRAERC